eukprot:scaffold11660_cov49-Attheya_sp.AAC.3
MTHSLLQELTVCCRGDPNKWRANNNDEDKKNTVHGREHRAPGYQRAREKIEINIIMEAKCHAEIIRLHEFFVKWFTAQLPKSEQAFLEGIQPALPPDFSMINPRGIILDLPALMDGLMGAHGSRPEQSEDGTFLFDIEIKNFQVLWETSKKGVCLVRYEEWQHGGDKNGSKKRVFENSRYSTVLFREVESPTKGKASLEASTHNNVDTMEATTEEKDGGKMELVPVEKGEEIISGLPILELLSMYMRLG